MQKLYVRDFGGDVRRALRRIWRTTLVLVFVAIIWAPTISGASNALICDRAARIAASEVGVPVDVMLAITRTETGRTRNGQLAPWPWTVNMEGKGLWFENKSEARSYAELHYSNGARSFDVGCFQLNHRWHGHHFQSIEDMFDPVENARYAAEFLSRLFAEMGSWSKAAAAYHSRTPKYADKYEARFKRILASLPERDRLQTPPLLPAATELTPRPNNFPLLIAGAKPKALGSLVPASTGVSRPFFGAGG